MPLFVKLPGQDQGVRHDAPVSAARIHGMARELLAGRLATSAELTAWLSGPAAP